VVTLRLRRVGRVPPVTLPRIQPGGVRRTVELVGADGRTGDAMAVGRGVLVGTSARGPLLVIDPEATTFVPGGWSASGDRQGSVVIERL